MCTCSAFFGLGFLWGMLAELGGWKYCYDYAPKSLSPLIRYGSLATDIFKMVCIFVGFTVVSLLSTFGWNSKDIKKLICNIFTVCEVIVAFPALGLAILIFFGIWNGEITYDGIDDIKKLMYMFTLWFVFKLVTFYGFCGAAKSYVDELRDTGCAETFPRAAYMSVPQQMMYQPEIQQVPQLMYYA